MLGVVRVRFPVTESVSRLAASAVTAALSLSGQTTHDRRSTCFWRVQKDESSVLGRLRKTDHAFWESFKRRIKRSWRDKKDGSRVLGGFKQTNHAFLAGLERRVRRADFQITRFDAFLALAADRWLGARSSACCHSRDRRITPDESKVLGGFRTTNHAFLAG